MTSDKGYISLVNSWMKPTSPSHETYKLF